MIQELLSLYEEYKNDTAWWSLSDPDDDSNVTLADFMAWLDLRKDIE